MHGSTRHSSRTGGACDAHVSATGGAWRARTTWVAPSPTHPGAAPPRPPFGQAPADLGHLGVRPGATGSRRNAHFAKNSGRYEHPRARSHSPLAALGHGWTNASAFRYRPGPPETDPRRRRRPARSNDRPRRRGPSSRARCGNGEALPWEQPCLSESRRQTKALRAHWAASPRFAGGAGTRMDQRSPFRYPSGRLRSSRSGAHG